MKAEDLVVADPHLERWLAVATRGLAEEPAARFREEIVDHVIEGVGDEVAAGAGPEAALSEVLAGLGDPERVGRALRRTNLRRWEAEMIGKIAEPEPRWVLALCLLGPPAYVAANLAALSRGGRMGFFVAGLVAMVVGLVADLSIARRLARAGRLRLALVSDVLGRWLFYAGLVVGSNLVIGRNSLAAPVVYLVALAVALGLVVHLWPKLRGRSAAS
jgi:hypothetical protein